MYQRGEKKKRPSKCNRFPSNHTQPCIKSNRRRTQTKTNTANKWKWREGSEMSRSNWWLRCSLSSFTFVWLTCMSGLCVRDAHTHTLTCTRSSNTNKLVKLSTNPAHSDMWGVFLEENSALLFLWFLDLFAVLWMNEWMNEWMLCRACSLLCARHLLTGLGNMVEIFIIILSEYNVKMWQIYAKSYKLPDKRSKKWTNYVKQLCSTVVHFVMLLLMRPNVMTVKKKTFLTNLVYLITAWSDLFN